MNLKMNDKIIAIQTILYVTGENYKEMRVIEKGSIGIIIYVSSYRTYTIKFEGIDEGVIVKDIEVKLNE